MQKALVSPDALYIVVFMLIHSNACRGLIKTPLYLSSSESIGFPFCSDRREDHRVLDHLGHMVGLCACLCRGATIEPFEGTEGPSTTVIIFTVLLLHILACNNCYCFIVRDYRRQ